MRRHEIGCLNHCPRGGGGGGLLAGIVAVVLLFAAIAAYHVRHGIETGLTMVAVVGEVIMWTVVASFVLSIAAVPIWAGWKIWQRIQAVRAARPVALPAPYRITQIGNRAPEAVEPAHTDSSSWNPADSARWNPAPAKTPVPRQEAAEDDARPYSRFR